jgi:thiamine biosynthesis lipoprotein
MKRVFVTILVVIAFLTACRKQALVKPVERTGFLMDTVVHISVYDAAVSEDGVQSAIDKCFQEMSRLEGMMSIHVDTSEIAEIVRGADKDSVAVSPETFTVLRRAIEVFDASGGAFDVTIGAVKDLWAFDAPNPKVPDPDAIRRLVQHVGSRKIVLHSGKAFLNDPNVRIDLGGIAKGYIVDRAVQVLRGAKIRAGILQAGGDMVVFGKRPGRKFWRIGVKHPRNSNVENGLIGLIETEGEKGISTSGDYERYFMVGGKRYHHILNPKTGYPATRCISVTIVAPNAIVSDAFSTAVFVLGPKKGMELIERLPELEGIIISEENGQIKQFLSTGLKSKYKSF